MTHHAYFYEGPLSHMSALAKSARTLFSFPDTHNPDVHIRHFETFGIEEARDIGRLASLRSLGGAALFVLGISSITSEAQQALLKLFEEPQQGVTFILLVPHGALLATLRSRCLPYPQKLEDKPEAGNAAEFLSEPYKMRSAMIAELLNEDDEGISERVREFLNTLETALYERPTRSTIREGLQDIGKIRSYLGDRAPSYKMLLEHLATTLPKL